MPDPIEININKIAQNILTFDKGVYWFNNLSIKEKQRALVLLKFYTEQTHPSQDTIDLGIDNIPLKTTMTPFVIFRTSPFKIALDKIVHLPDYELNNSFIALMTVFKYADTERRNTSCKGNCIHEWHQLNKKESKSANFIRVIWSRIKGS